jgi:hypothetical protein
MEASIVCLPGGLFVVNYVRSIARNLETSSSRANYEIYLPEVVSSKI